MFVFSNFLIAAAKVLSLALSIFMWIIIARAVLSWVNPDPWNPIVQFINRVTEPILAPIRRRVPSWRMGIDLSPLVAILAIYFIQWFLVGTLRDMAWRMR